MVISENGRQSQGRVGSKNILEGQRAFFFFFYEEHEHGFLTEGN